MLGSALPKARGKEQDKATHAAREKFESAKGRQTRWEFPGFASDRSSDGLTRSLRVPMADLTPHALPPHAEHLWCICDGELEQQARNPANPTRMMSEVE